MCFFEMRWTSRHKVCATTIQSHMQGRGTLPSPPYDQIAIAVWAASSSALPALWGGNLTQPCSLVIWLLVVVSWSWSVLSYWLKECFHLTRISSHAIVIPWLLSVNCDECCVRRPNWKWLMGEQSMVSVITGWRELSKRLLHQLI